MTQLQKDQLVVAAVFSTMAFIIIYSIFFDSSTPCSKYEGYRYEECIESYYNAYYPGDALGH